MGNLSSSCVTHFTNQFDLLVKILGGKIYGSYCKETLRYKNEDVVRIVPMISFCDIPLKTYANINAPYGKFAISLSKQWAINNKLNPVLYIEKNSILLDQLITSLKCSITPLEIAGKLNSISKKYYSQVGDIAKSVQYISYSLMYIKHYEDELKRENFYKANYRFYDEREWRFVPDYECSVCELKMSEDQYDIWRKTSKNKPVIENVALTFTANDITNILVENDEFRDLLIDKIENLELQFESTNRSVLISKIITFEQIEKDY